MLKITIITVCYNSVSTISDTIASVVRQNYDNIEHIIVDGGSTDGTLDIVRSAPGISNYISESDNGIYDAMNKGVALASGEVIGVLNADDFYPDSDVLNSVAQIFLDQPDIDMVLGDVDFVRSVNVTKMVRSYSAIKFSPWKLRFGFMPPHPGAFIKKSAYDQVGQYKLGYKIGADFDMFVRMLLVHKLDYVKLEKNLVRMRVGGVSTSGFGSYITSTKEILRSLNENEIYSNVFMILMRLPIKYVQKILPQWKVK
ncbi:MAG: glycosyltransferase family 2 protein [Porticoccaceae bacterium]